jgi:hypothetical protein
MEAVPKRLYELVDVIEARDNVPVDQRLRAISSLGDLLVQDLSEVGMSCLLDCIRLERNSRVIGHVMSVLARIKAEDAAPVVIDVLLGTHIDLYDHP